MISGGDLFLSYGAVHSATTLTIIIAVALALGGLVGGSLFYFLMSKSAMAGASQFRTRVLRLVGTAVVLALLVALGALVADAVKLGSEAKALQSWASTKQVKLTPAQAHDLLLTHASAATVKGASVVVRLSADQIGAAKLSYSN